MNDRQCCICGASYDDDTRSVLCPGCRESNRHRIRRMGRFIEVFSHVKLALEAAQDLAREYPDAAPLVDETIKALTAVYPGLSKVRRSLHRVDADVDRKLAAAFEQRDHAQQ